MKKQSFEILDFVTILKYKNDEANRRGIIVAIDKTKKRAFVSNLNMPFMGSVANWFDFKELEF